jgi:2'-5' RNA ligase
MRLFIAIDLPDFVRSLLGRRVESLRREVRIRARWVPSSNLHLTLVFLGQVQAQFLGTVKAAARRAAAVGAPFRLRLNSGGSFPRSGRARVLWAGVEAGEALASLHTRLQAELRGVDGVSTDDERDFHPHVTLARCRPPLSRAATGKTMERLRDVQSEFFEVRSVSLYESHTLPAGARHVRLESFALGASSGDRA